VEKGVFGSDHNQFRGSFSASYISSIESFGSDHNQFRGEKVEVRRSRLNVTPGQAELDQTSSPCFFPLECIFTTYSAIDSVMSKNPSTALRKSRCTLKSKDPLIAARSRPWSFAQVHGPVLRKSRCTLENKNPLIAAKSRPWPFVPNHGPVLRRTVLRSWF